MPKDGGRILIEAVPDAGGLATALSPGIPAVYEAAPQLAKAAVHSRGSFGAWRYEVSNQDHCFMPGVEWVNSSLLDVPETTARFAETANSMWGKSR